MCGCFVREVLFCTKERCAWRENGVILFFMGGLLVGGLIYFTWSTDDWLLHLLIAILSYKPVMKLVGCFAIDVVHQTLMYPKLFCMWCINHYFLKLSSWIINHSRLRSKRMGKALYPLFQRGWCLLSWLSLLVWKRLPDWRYLLHQSRRFSSRTSIVAGLMTSMVWRFEW